jgi:hypothetical protein
MGNGVALLCCLHRVLSYPPSFSPFPSVQSLVILGKPSDHASDPETFNSDV